MQLEADTFISNFRTAANGSKVRSQTRIQSILAKRNRTLPTAPELAAIALIQGGGYNEAVTFLNIIAADPDRRIYRHSASNIFLEALRTSSANPTSDLKSTIASLR